MAAYDNLRLEKGMYQVAGKSFTQVLEELDPSQQYRGTPLEGLDAYQRQLKRFDIKVSGKESDRIEKFFKTSDSALLFPAYLTKVVEQGVSGFDILDQIVATKTNIDSMDYRSITSVPSEENTAPREVLEGAQILMVPADFTMPTGKDHWETILRTRAIENGCYVVAPAQYGVKPKFQAYANSMVIDPWGNVIARASNYPQVITAEIDLDYIEKVRKQIFTLENRRPDIYSLSRTKA